MDSVVSTLEHVDQPMKLDLKRRNCCPKRADRELYKPPALRKKSLWDETTRAAALDGTGDFMKASLSSDSAEGDEKAGRASTLDGRFLHCEEPQTFWEDIGHLSSVLKSVSDRHNYKSPGSFPLFGGSRSSHKKRDRNLKSFALLSEQKHHSCFSDINTVNPPLYRQFAGRNYSPSAPGKENNVNIGSFSSRNSVLKTISCFEENSSLPQELKNKLRNEVPSASEPVDLVMCGEALENCTLVPCFPTKNFLFHSLETSSENNAMSKDLCVGGVLKMTETSFSEEKSQEVTFSSKSSGVVLSSADKLDKHLTCDADGSVTCSEAFPDLQNAVATDDCQVREISRGLGHWGKNAMKAFDERVKKVTAKMEVTSVTLLAETISVTQTDHAELCQEMQRPSNNEISEDAQRDSQGPGSQSALEIIAGMEMESLLSSSRVQPMEGSLNLCPLETHADSQEKRISRKSTVILPNCQRECISTFSNADQKEVLFHRFPTVQSSMSCEQPSWKTEFLERNARHGIKFIDSHCHLDFIFDQVNFQGSFSEFREKHKDTFPITFAGCVTIFCNPRTFGNDLFKSLLRQQDIWVAIGCHPKRATDMHSLHFDKMLIFLNHNKVVAIGEIGLDYSGSFYRHAEVQKRIFYKHLKIARDLKMPVVIHCRDSDNTDMAEEDCLEILKKVLPRDHKIHCHCYTKSYKCAQKWLDYFPNLYIGLTPLITYGSARPVHDTAERIPLDRLLLETDSPYFIPSTVPKGAMSHSHPGFAVMVAERVAELKNIPVEDILHVCLANTKNFYKI